MIAAQTSMMEATAERLAPGAVLLRRATQPDSTVYLNSGRVALGILDAKGSMVHQLGIVQGPAWLDAAAAILNLPYLVDGVAETEVELHRFPHSQFHAFLADPVPGPTSLGTYSLLGDMARAYRQQTELAVSRVAKDAEARCAEWLLRHAEPAALAGTGTVRLHQRKQLIAAQLGIAPETLSRVLRHLRDRSLISGSGRVFQLVDMGGLKALADT